MLNSTNVYFCVFWCNDGFQNDFCFDRIIVIFNYVLIAVIKNNSPSGGGLCVSGGRYNLARVALWAGKFALT